MKTFEKQAAQGDILIIKINQLPKGLSKIISEESHQCPQPTSRI